MRLVIAIFTLSIFVLGCGERSGRPGVDPSVVGTAKVSPPLAHGLQLDIRSKNNGNAVTMHCQLKNITAEAIEVDQSTLPWNNADQFSVDALASDGTTRQQQHTPPPVEIIRLSAPIAPISISPGESLKGKFDLEIMPIKNLSRSMSWTLRWSYGNLKVWHSDAQYMLSGATLVNAESEVAAAVPDTQPSSSVGGTSVAASAPDDAWFNPPGGTWIPNPAEVSDMKAALEEGLRGILSEKGDQTRPPVRYWFQYVGQGSGASKTIGVLGRPFPVSPRAATTFLGAFIPEDCHVQARYMPLEKRIADLVVGAFGCPRQS